MNFVDCYLLYFGQRLITCLLSALLPFQALFTESSCGYQLLASPLFSGALPATLLLCSVSFQFLIYSVFVFVFVFFQSRGSVFPGGYAGLSQEWLGEYHMTLGAHLLVY
jgi:hypothetical protein